MATLREDAVEFGSSLRRQEFAAKYPLIIESRDNLKTIWDSLLSSINFQTDDQKIIYGLARLSFDDEFQAMILLCANGYSETAIQVLRGLSKSSLLCHISVSIPKKYSFSKTSHGLIARRSPISSLPLSHAPGANVLKSFKM